MASLRPLQFRGLEDGTLLKDLDQEFRKTISEFLRFVAKNKSVADGSKATVSLKITVKCENAADKMFSIKTDVESKSPGRPSGVSIALANPSDAEDVNLYSNSTFEDEAKPASIPPAKPTEKQAI